MSSGSVPACVYKTRPLEKGKNMLLLKSIVCVTRNWVGWDSEQSCYAIYWVKLGRSTWMWWGPTQELSFFHMHRYLLFTCTARETGPEPSLYRGELLFMDSHFLQIYFLLLPYSLRHGSLHHDHHLRL